MKRGTPIAEFACHRGPSEIAGGVIKFDKAEGIKQQIKGSVNLVLGMLTGNEDRVGEGEVHITNGSNKKDRADWQDNVEKGAADPDNASNE
jgi:uncharacterized protein YjbJ (UPF0337 family)